ncbi:hypothetical protein HMPREF9350_05195 [Escherichia coli MS 85-1]|uniref:Uncharacterized protein n=1 Tax=Escherichia coli MS 85-1 TaxID=679202 RepID=A0AAN3SCR4_ECOLX|nr:hypothetical protein HMPREF9350_05195 [Escherichia coli MS 85-1]
MSGGTVPLRLISLILLFSLIPPARASYVAPKQIWTNKWDNCFAAAGARYQIERKRTACKRLVRTVLIFTESSDQLSRATDRVPGLPASPGYVQ